MLIPAFVVLMSCGVALVSLGFPLEMLRSLVWAFVLVFVPAFAVVIALTLLLASVVPLRVVQPVLHHPQSSYISAKRCRR